jgi:hypothetical protein
MYPLWLNTIIQFCGNPSYFCCEICNSGMFSWFFMWIKQIQWIQENARSYWWTWRWSGCIFSWLWEVGIYPKVKLRPLLCFYKNLQILRGNTSNPVCLFSQRWRYHIQRMGSWSTCMFLHLASLSNHLRSSCYIWLYFLLKCIVYLNYWSTSSRFKADSFVLLQSAALVGDFNNWNPNADTMTRVCLHLCSLPYLLCNY